MRHGVEPNSMDEHLRHKIVFVAPDGTRTEGPTINFQTSPDIPERTDASLWDRSHTVHVFREAVLGKSNIDFEPIIDALDRLDCWEEAVSRLTEGRRSPDLAAGRAVLSFWNTYGLHSIPNGLREKLPCLVDALRFFLPRYEGPSMTLYRGELASRHSEGIIGISWTPILSTAQIFAHRRSGEGRGVVLKIEASPEMIVTALRHHSDWTLTLEEDEYIVDPRLIGSVPLPDPSLA